MNVIRASVRAKSSERYGLISAVIITAGRRQKTVSFGDGKKHTLLLLGVS
jgi:hypothetical protein